MSLTSLSLPIAANLNLQIDRNPSLLWVSTGSNTVGQRIDMVRYFGSTTIDLQSLDLNCIPEDVYSLSQLESLLVRNNDLECDSEKLYISINLQISQLSNLTVLDLGYNRLKIIPPAIFEIPRLESLILNNNQLESVDPRISKLGATLKTLHLGANQIRALPESMGQLTALYSLIAPTNQITSLPDSMSNLVSLEDIYLRSNHIAEFPLVLCNLPLLKIVSIEENRIVQLPSASLISKLSVLHSIPQEVIPNVFIGAATCSLNRRALALLEISDHICLTEPCSDPSHKPPVSDSILTSSHYITMCDVEAQDIQQSIGECNAFLEESLKQGRRVLVNSTLGVSRSVAMICAYLIKNMHMTYDDALAKIRLVRPNAKPNPGFERQLRAYERSLV